MQTDETVENMDANEEKEIQLLLKETKWIKGSMSWSIWQCAYKYSDF